MAAARAQASCGRSTMSLAILWQGRLPESWGLVRMEGSLALS